MANVLGVVLLVAVVLTAVSVLAAVSAQTMTERTQAIAGETARGDLTTLSETAIAVAHGGHHRERVSLSGTDTSAVDAYEVAASGRMTVAVGSDAAGWRRVASVPLGTVLADTGSSTVALQGGGVWRVRNGQPESAEVLRGPPISVIDRSDVSLTLPVYRVDGEHRIGGDVDVTVGDQRPLYDPVYVPSGDAVRVTVTSRFAHAWARAFEESFPDVDTDVGVAGERVTVTYRANGDRYLQGAIHRIEIDD